MKGCNMKDKNDIKYLIIIILLIIILAVLWILIINNLNNNSNSNNNMNNNFGFGMNNNSNIEYSSVKDINKDEDITSGEYKSTKADENVVSVSGNVKSTLSDITVKKSGDSLGGDTTSFYGTNSAIIAKGGANLTIKNANITTDATGANGVFSYGGSATTTNNSSDGTTINISDSTITTNKDNSGGIMTTGGGNMNASNLTINTSGISSAAIRSDRGGGVVNVDRGTYTTTGKGSPAVYSTADITVKNATLVSETSEGLIIEGKNKITIENVKLTDTNSELNGQSTTYKNIFIYQSMSGDADTGTAEFSSKDSTIITNKGDSIYVTNTKASIVLENNQFINNDKAGNFIRIQKDSWGSSGSNGGDVELSLINQNVNGNIVVDSISKLSINMTKSSYYEGCINSSNEAKEIKITLDKDSSIKLTGDSYISSLEDLDETYSNIDFNGYKLYVNGKELKK